MIMQEGASSSAAAWAEERGMLAWGRWGTWGLHQCNSYFARLPQPFMRSLWSLQGLPTTVLPFLNPPCFDVFISGIFFILLHPVTRARAELMGTFLSPMSGGWMGRERRPGAAGGEERLGEPSGPD